MTPLDTDQSDSYQNRLDLEWGALNAIRETLRIALKGQRAFSYNQALALGKELLTKLFDSDDSLISRGQEPAIVREFREEAELESLAKKQTIDPVELVERELKRVERLLQIPGEHKESYRRQRRLLGALEFFRKKNYSEHQLIRRDVFQAHRPDLPSKRLGDNFAEYELPYGRTLRLRMLHPDAPEHSTGADVIYEQCDEEEHLVRFAFLQYKIWSGDRFYFSESPNFEKQFAKLSAIICDDGYCLCTPSTQSKELYRLPCCAAFLRLTDRLQSASARLVSTGYHVPICVVRDRSESTRSGAKMITRRGILGSYLTTKIFEQMFNNAMLGSRWLPYADVERLYQRHGILDSAERLIVYAQMAALVRNRIQGEYSSHLVSTDPDLTGTEFSIRAISSGVSSNRR